MEVKKPSAATETKPGWQKWCCRSPGRSGWTLANDGDSRVPLRIWTVSACLQEGVGPHLGHSSFLVLSRSGLPSPKNFRQKGGGKIRSRLTYHTCSPGQRIWLYQEAYSHVNKSVQGGKRAFRRLFLSLPQWKKRKKHIGWNEYESQMDPEKRDIWWWIATVVRNWCSEPNNEFILEISASAIWPSAAEQKLSQGYWRSAWTCPGGFTFFPEWFIYLFVAKTQLLVLF